MCNKFTFLISLCLLVGLTANTFAQIGWDDGGADHFWNTAENWIGDAVPTNEDEVRIGMQDPNGAVIDASHSGANKAVAFWAAVGHQAYGDGDMEMTGGELEVGFDDGGGMTVGNENIGNLIMSGGTISTLYDRFAVGRGNDYDGHGTLIMTGGELNVGSASGSYMVIGWLGKGIGVVDMTSGTINVNGTLYVGHNDGDGSLIMKGGTIDAKVLQIGNMSGSTGDVNMVSGTINIKNAINVGNKSGGTGTLTMTSGQISADADKKGSGNLNIGNNGSAGHVQLDGGTFYADNLTIGNNDTMDITGGTLILKGNDVGEVDGFAAAGKITGGGQSDPRYVYRKYDSATDETTVKYDPDGPKFASDEKPKDHAGVGETPPLPFRLSWSPGDGAVTHDVYFGTNETAVTDANRANQLGVLVSENQAEEYYDVSTLVKDTIYYWRIDEVSNPSIWKGRIWQFSTKWNPIVDDFEDYENDSDLWNTWNDYYNNGTQSTVYLATGTAYNSKQSMEVWYENYVAPYYSEVDRDVNDPNWKRVGYVALSLWFRGHPNNDANEQMYLALEDSSGNSAKVLYDGDQNDLSEASWHRWDIELQRFNDINGVVLTDVNHITIGFGDGNDPSPGGFGESVWFDDIKLVKPRCRKTAGFTPDGRFAGWNSGCVINNKELEIMTDDWVLSEHNVTAVAPSDANLEAYYDFENDLDDSSGNLRHGSPNDPCGTLTYDNGKVGTWALELDGTNYVDIIGYKGVTGPNSRTCCAWLKTPLTTNGEILYWGYNTLGHKWEILIENGKLRVEVQGGSRAGSTDVNDGQWHHVAVVLVDDGSPNVKEAKLYVDGVREVISSQSEEPVDTYSIRDVKIGQGNNDYYFDGLIDEVRIYSRVLSQAEIVYLAKGPGGEVFQPLPPLLSTSNDTDLYDDEKINFKDFARLADAWLKNQLWPE